MSTNNDVRRKYDGNKPVTKEHRTDVVCSSLMHFIPNLSVSC